MSRKLRWKHLLCLLPPLIISVHGQGYVGGSQSSCSASQKFTYLGCYSNADNGPNAGFTWQLSSDPHSPNYYPGYDGHLTPTICSTGCRGHGFKYASLSSQTNCFCSADFPNPTAQDSTTAGPGLPQGQNPGNSADVSVCHVSGHGCSGDSAQFCGSAAGSDVYVDNTIPHGDSDRQASNYLYIGCFSKTPPGPFYAFLETTSSADCAAYCGLLGYSFMGRDGFDSDAQGNSNNGYATCGCGSEIQTGDQVDESFCSFGCDGSTNAL